MTSDYKAALDISNAKGNDVKDLDFGNVFWACGVLAKEAESLRRENMKLQEIARQAAEDTEHWKRKALEALR